MIVEPKTILQWCMYVCMCICNYICMCICMYICMYLYSNNQDRIEQNKVSNPEIKLLIKLSLKHDNLKNNTLQKKYKMKQYKRKYIFTSKLKTIEENALF